MASEDFYNWKPLLDDEDTRVIQVPPSPAFEDAVRCKTIHVSPKDPPRYRTISYAWGPTHPDGSHLTNTIYVDNRYPQAFEIDDDVLIDWLILVVH